MLMISQVRKRKGPIKKYVNQKIRILYPMSHLAIFRLDLLTLLLHPKKLQTLSWKSDDYWYKI